LDRYASLFNPNITNIFFFLVETDKLNYIQFTEEKMQSEEFTMALSLQEKLASANSTVNSRSFDPSLRNLAKNDRSTASLLAGVNASESNSIVNYVMDEGAFNLKINNNFHC
jgi:hypothetical protein